MQLQKKLFYFSCAKMTKTAMSINFAMNFVTGVKTVLNAQITTEKMELRPVQCL
jgi:cytochrome bd-type quinol oxidase subunit 1